MNNRYSNTIDSTKECKPEQKKKALTKAEEEKKAKERERDEEGKKEKNEWFGKFLGRQKKRRRKKKEDDDAGSCRLLYLTQRGLAAEP